MNLTPRSSQPRILAAIGFGLLVTTTASLTGQSGRALAFDGADDRVTGPSGGPLNLTDTYTLEAWVRPDALNQERTILTRGQGSASAQNYLFVVWRDGRIALNHGVSSWQYSNGSIAIDVWTHVAVVVTPGNYAFYVNGVLDGSGAHDGNLSLTPSTDSLQLGKQGTATNFFSGDLDEVRIWDSARSAAQIQAGLSGISNPTSEANLVVYYRLDDQGQVATDASANGQHAFLGRDATTEITDPITVTAQTVPMGRVLQFDGADDRVTGPAGGPLNLTDTYTLEAWVRPESIGSPSTILGRGRGSAGAQDYLFLVWDDGRVALTHGTAAWVFSNSSIAADAWTHVAVVVTPGSYAFYVNGAPDGTGTHNGNTALPPSTDPLQLGKQGRSTNYFIGKLDEVRIWNAARSAEQIQSGVAGISNPASETSLVAYYRFEGSGQTVTDSSANGLDAVLGVDAALEPTEPFRAATFSPPASHVLAFDGSDDRVTGPSGGLLNLGDTYTLEAWVRPESTGEFHAILGRGQGVGARQDLLFLIWNDGRVALSHGDPRWVYSTTAVAADVWTHVAVSVSARNYRFYVNGVPAGSGRLSRSSLLPGVEPLLLGKQGRSANFFRGELDEVRIWNVARRTQRIRGTIEGVPAPANEPNLVVYYRMDGTGQNLFDSSANGLDASLGVSSSPEASDPMRTGSQPGLAACVFRNGSGVNPADYTCTTPPALGTDWETQITTTPTTLSTAVLLGFAGPSAGVPLLGGELLIQISPLPAVRAGFGTHTLPLPFSSSLSGVTLATQAIRIESQAGAAVLTLLNALDIRLGQ